MESDPGWRGSTAAANGGGEGSYPTVREVLQTSPLLMPRLFPGASAALALQEQKPLSPLPSRYLLRTGRVVGVLAEDSASRRLVGSLIFESALLLPSVFVEAESLDEFTRPRQGVVEGRDGLPMAVPSVNCFFLPERVHCPRIKLIPSSVPEGLAIFLFYT